MINITGLLLAAGQSRRFGSDKLLHVLGNGKTMGQQSAENLLTGCKNSIAVINEDSTELMDVFSSAGLRVVKKLRMENSQGVISVSSASMGCSIACGVRAIDSADACLVALADMPFIKPETIERIIGEAEKSTCIVAPVYKGVRGHPVLFSQYFFSELAQLSDDMGARSIIKNNLEHLILIDIDDEGVIKDIDTPSDLE